MAQPWYHEVQLESFVIFLLLRYHTVMKPVSSCHRVLDLVHGNVADFDHTGALVDRCTHCLQHTDVQLCSFGCGPHVP